MEDNVLYNRISAIAGSGPSGSEMPWSPLLKVSALDFFIVLITSAL